MNKEGEKRMDRIDMTEGEIANNFSELKKHIKPQNPEAL